MNNQHQFIMLQSASSFRFYFPDRRLIGREIHEFLKSVTVWQDHNIEIGSVIWNGYECLPGVHEHIKGILEKHFGAENITEQYVENCLAEHDLNI